VRILYITERFAPLIGGIETMSEYLLSVLRERGHHLHVVTSHSGAALPDRDTWAGIPLTRLHMLTALTRRDLKLIAATRAALSALKRDFQPDFVHIQFSGPSSLFHWDTLSAHPTRTLVTLHSVPPQMAGARSLLLGTLQKADWVTAVSAYMLAWARAQAPEIEARSSVVYNGVPPVTTVPASLPLDPPCILWIGRMVAWKRVDLLLRALSLMPRVRLLLAGDGPERAALTALATELGVAERVDFLGWVGRSSLPDLINRATVLVIPSSAEENLPMVAIEAAQMGRPVIAARLSGLPEIIQHGETGVLLDEMTPEALAQALDALLQDPATLTAMGQAARRVVQSRFTVAHMVDAYDCLYTRVAAQSQEQRT
jgi:glycogen(starch) synthase